MKNEKNEIQQQLDTFMMGLITCHKCGSLELPMKFENLPTVLKINWAKMPKNSLFLHCKHCDEWDVVKPREKVL
jgi:translation initiation factor 2 beta subunit (eIF-2beta)/eIF-5